MKWIEPRWMDRGLLVTALFFAGLNVAVTVSTLLSSTLIRPFHDQFRLNLRYLSESFPMSVLLLENGHRPVFPGIARVIELNALGGAQWVQGGSALAIAIVCTALLAREICRSFPPLFQAAGVALVTTLLWWNAHARMFIHVYEAVHLFYIVGGLLSALWIAHSAARTAWPIWWHFAWLSCVFAALSFGPGIATFGALFVAAVLLRAPARVLVTIMVTAISTLVVYMYVLPGADGVRHSTDSLDPAAALYFFTCRLGAPAYEFFRYAKLNPDFAKLFVLIAGTCILVIGFVTAVMFIRGVLVATRLAIFGVGFLMFGAGANFLITLSRTSYFAEHPDQLFADRYLFWSSITWIGAVILILLLMQKTIGGGQRILAVGVTLIVMAALPVSIALNGWAAEVYRQVEWVAVGMQLGVADRSRTAAIADAGVPVAEQAVMLMRKRALAGYSEHEKLALPPKNMLNDPNLPKVALDHGELSTQFRARLDKAVARSLRGDWLWVVDEKGGVVGLAAPTRVSGGARNRLRIGRPALDVIEGYWSGSPASAKWLLVLDGDTVRVVAGTEAQAIE